jgi:hypothetical protein
MFSGIAALLACCLLLQSAFGQPSKPFGGRVFEAQSKRGIENLEVRLRPPSESSSPTLIGNTDQNGAFRFSQVKSGRYLLEVSQGPYLLYRHEIDTSQVDRIDIPIERR